MKALLALLATCVAAIVVLGACAGGVSLPGTPQIPASSQVLPSPKDVKDIPTSDYDVIVLCKKAGVKDKHGEVVSYMLQGQLADIGYQLRQQMELDGTVMTDKQAFARLKPYLRYEIGVLRHPVHPYARPSLIIRVTTLESEPSTDKLTCPVTR